MPSPFILSTKGTQTALRSHGSSEMADLSKDLIAIFNASAAGFTRATELLPSIPGDVDSRSRFTKLAESFTRGVRCLGYAGTEPVMKSFLSHREEALINIAATLLFVAKTLLFSRYLGLAPSKSEALTKL